MYKYIEFTYFYIGPDSFLLEALFRNEVWDHLSQPVSFDNE